MSQGRATGVFAVLPTVQALRTTVVKVLRDELQLRGLALVLPNHTAGHNAANTANAANTVPEQQQQQQQQQQAARYLAHGAIIPLSFLSAEVAAKTSAASTGAAPAVGAREAAARAKRLAAAAELEKDFGLLPPPLLLSLAPLTVAPVAAGANSCGSGGQSAVSPSPSASRLPLRRVSVGGAVAQAQAAGLATLGAADVWVDVVARVGEICTNQGLNHNAASAAAAAAAAAGAAGSGGDGGAIGGRRRETLGPAVARYLVQMVASVTLKRS